MDLVGLNGRGIRAGFSGALLGEVLESNTGVSDGHFLIDVAVMCL